MEGHATPEEAALSEMPAGITHEVQTIVDPGGRTAYVLLAVEANPPGFYLDENICFLREGGRWWAGDSGGGGFTDRSLADLRAAPPPRGLWSSPE
jgi:hypothetical protein